MSIALWLDFIETTGLRWIEFVFDRRLGVLDGAVNTSPRLIEATQDWEAKFQALHLDLVFTRMICINGTALFSSK